MKKVWWIPIAAAVTLLVASPAMALGDSDMVAQFGKIRKFVDKTQKESAPVENVQSNSSTDRVQKSAPLVALSEDGRKALEKIRDESKREAPAVWALNYGADEGGGSENDTRQNHANYIIKLHKKTRDEVKAFKAQLEARHAENLAIVAALTDANGRRIPEGRDGLAYDDVKKEIARYESLMSRARDAVNIDAKIEVKNNQPEIKKLRIGMHYVKDKNGKMTFCRSEGEDEMISPPDEDMYNAARERYSNLTLLLYQEPPAKQYPEHMTAQLANQYIFRARKNALASETKKPIPASQMNNPALNAKMLKLAKEAYPTWGIVKVVIVEPNWRVEKNRLGQIIHRRINTKIIMPKSSGSGYIMRTLSFIEPYTGGGNYGAVKAFGIGTDEAAVDYKK